MLVLPPSRQPVIHSYSDSPEEGIHIESYSYPEVFGEKVRALGERGRPRDLYDVINLYRNDQLPASAVIQDVLAQKCDYKNIQPPVLGDMDAYRNVLEQNWEPMLAHQLPSLPALEVYWDALPEFFEWLAGEASVDRPQLAAVTQSDIVYRPSYGQLGLRALNGQSLEIIRFAAGNHLCVDLDYTDNNGNRRSRIIEPYSLRRAGTGNILLYALRADGGGIRAYKITQINNASVTNQVFDPKYQIELTPSMGGDAVPSAESTANSLGIPRMTRGRRRPIH